MRFMDCQFEAEVLGAVVEGRWPEGVESGLRTHAATCPTCSETAAVAGAIGAAREEARRNASVPDAGRVWWRAQLRMRREAARAAGRPITVTQVISFACAAGLVGACFGATSSWFQSVLGGIGAAIGGLDFYALASSTAMLIEQHSGVFLAAGAALLLIPAGVWAALLRD